MRFHFGFLNLFLFSVGAMAARPGQESPFMHVDSKERLEAQAEEKRDKEADDAFLAERAELEKTLKESRDLPVKALRYLESYMFEEGVQPDQTEKFLAFMNKPQNFMGKTYPSGNEQLKNEKGVGVEVTSVQLSGRNQHLVVKTKSGSVFKLKMAYEAGKNGMRRYRVVGIEPQPIGAP